MARRPIASVVVAFFGIALLTTGLAPLGRVVAHPPAHHRDNTEPQLRSQAETALTGGPEDRSLIRVEALTEDSEATANALQHLGGTITGSVAGLVEGVLPADQLESLAATPSVTYVRRPVRVNRPLPIEAQGFGPTVGDEVALTNAGAWHDAGITGNVKVGIIDFFDLRLWQPTEHGPVPDAAHQFCPDRVNQLCTQTGQIYSPGGDRHGVAVAEVVKDMAPSAELFIATTATTAQTQQAIDWFVANDVHIITRSLGAPYDGPGDGSGPLDGVVDYAVAHGITWFNSAGNDAYNGYGRYADGVDANGYVDFLNGPGVDTYLRIDPSPSGVAFDGIRWANDWGLPPSSVTDYAVQFFVGTSESALTPLTVRDDPQVGGAPPLEAVDQQFDQYQLNGQALFLRMHAEAHYNAAAPDTIEVATFYGGIQQGRQSAAYSAAKPVVDSKNPGLVAVGAIDPADGSKGIAFYSSRGPTNDGRVKPDISAPSCVHSTIYSPTCFNGTSAASPVVAGAAALLLGRGLAMPGVALAALTRHLVRDLGPPGLDSAYGSGEVTLPAAPSAVSSTASVFKPLAAPARLLDTRPDSFIGPATVLPGPYAQFAIIDLPVAGTAGIPSDATAVAVNITSTDSVWQYYVQALPTLAGAVGAFSTLNISAPGVIRPNFAIVPLGQRSISVFIPNGGNVIIDVMGYFTSSGASTAGRFVPLDPHRVLDTRPDQPGPTPQGWVPHQPHIGEMVRVDVPSDAGVPDGGANALVVNVTATEASGGGYLQALPTGAAPGQTSNVNYVAGENAATLAVVPVGPGGTITIFTSNSAHIVVDLLGYMTSTSAPSSATGRFVPVTPARYYDSRNAPNAVHAGGSITPVTLRGDTTSVPGGAAAISMNLTADQEQGAGFITLFPADGSLPRASNLNYVAQTPVANAALVKLGGPGVDVFVNVATHVIIDVNGYFTG